MKKALVLALLLASAAHATDPMWDVLPNPEAVVDTTEAGWAAHAPIAKAYLDAHVGEWLTASGGPPTTKDMPGDYPVCWHINDYFWRCRDGNGNTFGLHVYELWEGYSISWCENMRGEIFDCPW